jgi:hypothetical protein
MRTIIKLFAILTILVAAEAQDREPSAWLFKWGFSETERAFVPDSFPPPVRTSVLMENKKNLLLITLPNRIINIQICSMS